MDQAAFSNIVRDYLLVEYPIFVPAVSYHDDGSFDCAISNFKGEFSIWIATYNCEITIGLQAPDGNSDCHRHMSFYGEEPNEQLDAMRDYLEKIFSDKLLFLQSSQRGYTWTDNAEETIRQKEKDESIKFFKWSET